MHRKSALIAALLAAVSISIAREPSLTWRTFDEGMAEARKSNKKILVDVYTNWCGWCKRMESQTYADKEVARYLGQRYVLVKLNAESDRKLYFKDKQYSEAELAQAFGIDGYPSTIFLKPDGEPITVYPGYADPEKFKQVLSYIADDYYLTKKFEEYLDKKN